MDGKKILCFRVSFVAVPNLYFLFLLYPIVGWLKRTPAKLVQEGKNEAYCKLCRSTIRPQRNDLIAHKNTKIHKRAEEALPGKGQPTLQNFGMFTSIRYLDIP